MKRRGASNIAVSASPQQQGAALVEFAIVLPFIILFFFGIIEFGRVFSQISWYAGMNYEAVLSGIRAPGNAVAVNSAVNSAFNRMYNAYQQEAIIRLADDPDILDHDNHVDIINRTVSIRSSAPVQSVLGSAIPQISMSFLGNSISQGETPVDQYSSPANPNPLYNCSNDPVGASRNACNFGSLQNNEIE